jgi:hypothetical protein
MWNGCKAVRTGSAASCPADIELTQAPAGAELGDLLERGEPNTMRDILLSEGQQV